MDYVIDKSIRYKDDSLSFLSFSFPARTNKSYKNLFAYLAGRGIPSELIQILVDCRLMYQTEVNNNIVFVNYSQDWGEIRGTYTINGASFKGSVKHSRSNGSWWFRTSEAAEIAYICKSAIDAISLYLVHRHQDNPPEAYYYSIGGLGTWKQEAIEKIRKTHTATILAVDKNVAGTRCREMNLCIPSIIPKKGDWNDDLLYMLNTNEGLAL